MKIEQKTATKFEKLPKRDDKLKKKNSRTTKIPKLRKSKKNPQNKVKLEYKT